MHEKEYVVYSFTTVCLTADAFFFAFTLSLIAFFVDDSKTATATTTMKTFYVSCLIACLGAYGVTATAVSSTGGHLKKAKSPKTESSKTKKPRKDSKTNDTPAPTLGPTLVSTSATTANSRKTKSSKTKSPKTKSPKTKKPKKDSKKNATLAPTPGPTPGPTLVSTSTTTFNIRYTAIDDIPVGQNAETNQRALKRSSRNNNIARRNNRGARNILSNDKRRLEPLEKGTFVSTADGFQLITTAEVLNCVTLGFPDDDTFECAEIVQSFASTIGADTEVFVTKIIASVANGDYERELRDKQGLDDAEAEAISFPSESPTVAPSDVPSPSPTKSPSAAPTKSPTNAPTKSPTTAPSASQTASPSDSTTTPSSLAPSPGGTILPTTLVPTTILPTTFLPTVTASPTTFLPTTTFAPTIALPS